MAICRSVPDLSSERSAKSAANSNEPWSGCERRMRAVSPSSKPSLPCSAFSWSQEHRRMPSVEADQAPMPNGSRPIQPDYPRSPNDGRSAEPEHRPIPRVLQSPASPREALADFIARKLAELGPGSQEDLSSVAAQEGYFPDTQHARPSVHATVIDLLRRQRIRQLPDGTLAPATVSQMIRLQQTM